MTAGPSASVFSSCTARSIGGSVRTKNVKPSGADGAKRMCHFIGSGKKDADNGDYAEGYGGGIKDSNPERVDSKAPPGPTEMERLRIELAERDRQ